jgi:hypothetical protein
VPPYGPDYRKKDEVDQEIQNGNRQEDCAGGVSQTLAHSVDHGDPQLFHPCASTKTLMVAANMQRICSDVIDVRDILANRKAKAWRPSRQVVILPLIFQMVDLRLPFCRHHRLGSVQHFQAREIQWDAHG